MPRRRWTLLDFAKTLATKFETDWQRVPLERRQSWARVVVVGIVSVVSTLLVMIATLKYLSAGANHFPWEESVLRNIDQGPISFGNAVWMQTFGTDFMLVGVVAVATTIAIWNDRPILALSILLSLIVMDAIVRIGWFALARERPDIIAGGLASPGFHSFPSGHTSKSVAVYGLLIAQWFRATPSRTEKMAAAILALAISLAVPFGRMRMGVHWPIDVMGGYLLGAIWLGFLLHALGRAGMTATARGV